MNGLKNSTVNGVFMVFDCEVSTELNIGPFNESAVELQIEALATYRNEEITSLLESLETAFDDPKDVTRESAKDHVRASIHRIKSIDRTIDCLVMENQRILRDAILAGLARNEGRTKE